MFLEKLFGWIPAIFPRQRKKTQRKRVSVDWSSDPKAIAKVLELNLLDVEGCRYTVKAFIEFRNSESDREHKEHCKKILQHNQKLSDLVMCEEKLDGFLKANLQNENELNIKILSGPIDDEKDRQEVSRLFKRLAPFYDGNKENFCKLLLSDFLPAQVLSCSEDFVNYMRETNLLTDAMQYRGSNPSAKNPPTNLKFTPLEIKVHKKLWRNLQTNQTFATSVFANLGGLNVPSRLAVSTLAFFEVNCSVSKSVIEPFKSSVIESSRKSGKWTNYLKRIFGRGVRSSDKELLQLLCNDIKYGRIVESEKAHKTRIDNLKAKNKKNIKKLCKLEDVLQGSIDSAGKTLEEKNALEKEMLVLREQIYKLREDEQEAQAVAKAGMGIYEQMKTQTQNLDIHTNLLAEKEAKIQADQKKRQAELDKREAELDKKQSVLEKAEDKLREKKNRLKDALKIRRERKSTSAAKLSAQQQDKATVKAETILPAGVGLTSGGGKQQKESTVAATVNVRKKRHAKQKPIVSTRFAVSGDVDIRPSRLSRLSSHRSKKRAPDDTSLPAADKPKHAWFMPKPRQLKKLPEDKQYGYGITERDCISSFVPPICDE